MGKYRPVGDRHPGRGLLTGTEKQRQMMDSLDRITFDPDVMGGRACIRGMRITVSLLLDLVAKGMTVDEILAAYPYLEPEDIEQALRYGAWLAEDAVYPLTV